MSTSPMSPTGFLGTGWSFPPEFRMGGAEVLTVSNVEDVHQALTILLATRPGERTMQESFGCALDSVLFDEMDKALSNRVEALISSAILNHETRVSLLDVNVAGDASEAGMLHITIQYAVKGSNSRYNMVFPFYLNEATRLAG